MSIRKKLVSIIMPTYNAEKYIREAIESIENQTYKKWELIIVDDASTDTTKQIVNDYIKIDSRIKLFEGKKCGIGGALNLGIEVADGDYIARMDADDISLSERLAKQVEFMEQHNDVGVCATQFRTFSFNKISKKNACELFTDQDIKAGMIFCDVIGHPTIMFRKKVFEDGWRYTESIIAEDYDLWTRMIPNIKFVCLEEVLLYYRQEDQNFSSLVGIEKLMKADKCIIRAYITRVFKLDLSDYYDEDFGLYYYWVKDMYMYLIRQLKLLNQIYEQNQHLKVLSPLALKKSFQRRLNSLIRFMLPDGVRKINDKLVIENFDEVFNSDKSLQEYKNKINEIHEFYLKFIENFRKVIFYGMGTEGEDLLQVFLSLHRQKKTKWSLEALIDKNVREVVVNSEQYIVYEPQYLKELKPDLILICTNRHYDEVKKELIDMGIEFKQILSGNILRFL